jgi:hypothetical protein
MGIEYKGPAGSIWKLHSKSSSSKVNDMESSIFFSVTPVELEFSQVNYL